VIGCCPSRPRRWGAARAARSGGGAAGTTHVRASAANLVDVISLVGNDAHDGRSEQFRNAFNAETEIPTLEMPR